MTFEYLSSRTPVGLLAKFRDRRDAQAAAVFFAERGIAIRALPLPQPTPSASTLTDRPLRRPLTYAAFGALLLGLAGNLVWLALFPDVLSAGWRLALTMLAGGSAAASIGVVVDSGLAPPREEGGIAIDDGGAVIALRVQERQVDYAADVLHQIGADRVVLLDESTTSAEPRVIRAQTPHHFL